MVSTAVVIVAAEEWERKSKRRGNRSPLPTMMPIATVAFHAALRYCENMKNITVTVEDDLYRLARIKAAERDTSISALVKRFLVELASESPGPRQLEDEERELRARIGAFTAGDRLSRDDAHRR